jgi:reactive chlorine resistance protein C
MIGASTQRSSTHEPLARAVQNEHAGIIRSLYGVAARFDRFGFGMLRLGLVIVLCWIGGLKAANYEAEGIVPFVANSPLMSFFYHRPAPEYREQNPAGGVNLADHEWNETNGTYVFRTHWAALLAAWESSSLSIHCSPKLLRSAAFLCSSWPVPLSPSS